MALLEDQNTIPTLKEEYEDLTGAKSKSHPNSQMLWAHKVWMTDMCVPLKWCHILSTTHIKSPNTYNHNRLLYLNIRTPFPYWRSDKRIWLEQKYSSTARCFDWTHDGWYVCVYTIGLVLHPDLVQYQVFKYWPPPTMKSPKTCNYNVLLYFNLRTPFPSWRSGPQILLLSHNAVQQTDALSTHSMDDRCVYVIGVMFYLDPIPYQGLKYCHI